MDTFQEGTLDASVDGGARLQERGSDVPFEGNLPEPSPAEEGGSLYEGDAGDLPTPVRRALTMLLKYPSISDLENSDAYRTTVDEKPRIERALANLGLTLTVNERYGVAYATQANVAGRNTLVSLKANMPVSRDVSVLLVSLRVQQHALEARGDQHWFVDREDLEGMLKSGPYAGDRDGGRISKSLETALTQLENLGYLKAVDARKERFRIMPILPAVFSLERTYELLEMFGKLMGDTQGKAAHDAQSDGGSDTPELPDGPGTSESPE